MMDLLSGHLFHVLGAAALMGLLVFGLIGLLVRFDKRGKSSYSRGHRSGFENEFEKSFPVARKRKKKRSKR